MGTTGKVIVFIIIIIVVIGALGLGMDANGGAKPPIMAFVAIALVFVFRALFSKKE